MAKARRRRGYRRKSGRWAPNIIKIANTNSATVGEFYNYEDLAINPVQSNTGVAQTFTVKNVEISFTLEGNSTQSVTSIEAVTAYIMYVPQGMALTPGYYAEHPEYIMAYKFIGSLSNANAQQESGIVENQQYQPLRIKSRLSRKLQTGDRIVLYVQGSNSFNNSLNYNIFGLVRWWSKAN